MLFVFGLVGLVFGWLMNRSIDWSTILLVDPAVLIGCWSGPSVCLSVLVYVFYFLFWVCVSIVSLCLVCLCVLSERALVVHVRVCVCLGRQCVSMYMPLYFVLMCVCMSPLCVSPSCVPCSSAFICAFDLLPSGGVSPSLLMVVVMRLTSLLSHCLIAIV